VAPARGQYSVNPVRAQLSAGGLRVARAVVEQSRLKTLPPGSFPSSRPHRPRTPSNALPTIPWRIPKRGCRLEQGLEWLPTPGDELVEAGRRRERPRVAVGHFTAISAPPPAFTEAAHCTAKEAMTLITERSRDVARASADWMRGDASDERQLLGSITQRCSILMFRVRDSLVLATGVPVKGARSWMRSRVGLPPSRSRLGTACFLRCSPTFRLRSGQAH
jgi:hypothetical protein